MGGILISRGVSPRIPIGGLVIHIDPESGPQMELKNFELQLDTCFYWLEIALDQIEIAKGAHDEMCVGTFNSPDGINVLEREFKASLQATFAAATFFEALYAVTLERDPQKTQPTIINSKKRPSRYAKVAEQLRRSFGLKNEGTKNLRAALKEIYRFRDQAVHPSAQYSKPVMHSILRSGVEIRFVMFSFENAKIIVHAALAYSKILPSGDLTKKPKPIQDYGCYILTACAPLYERWEQQYGQLLDPPPNS